MGASSKYLVIYHAISAGQNGPNLGCDEEEIVMILYLVLNVAENKVRPYYPLLVKLTIGILEFLAWDSIWSIWVSPTKNESRMLGLFVWGLERNTR